MAQFSFNNDASSILKRHIPISNDLVSRWQRKTSASNTSTLGALLPGTSGNVSTSSSKTQNEATGRNIRQMMFKMGPDRFIPARNNKQMEVASFLLTKKNDPDEECTAASSERRKAFSIALNGFNIEDAKILNLAGMSQCSSEANQNNLKVLHSQPPTRASTKKTRHISTDPDRVLGAPLLRNDFYLNLLDWSSRNMLAVGLHNNVHLWDATEGNFSLIMKLDSEVDYICSLSWTKEGNYLAIGTSDSKVQLWDVELQKRLRTMCSHTARVGSLSWNDRILSSGSRSGHIHHHDVRMAEHHVSTLSGHTQEVCGLKWSSDGRYLASGGKDNLVHVWPRVQGGAGNDSQAIHCWREHQGPVKALGWCPWQPNILATGGGVGDRFIHIWNVNNGSGVSSYQTQSQISSLVFAPNHKELVSAHGYAQNHVVVWEYPSLTKVVELNGHKNRIFNLVLSPDESTIATIAGDKTIRIWKSFELDNLKKKATVSMPTARLHKPIRA